LAWNRLLLITNKPQLEKLCSSSAQFDIGLAEVVAFSQLRLIGDFGQCVAEAVVKIESG
jgi:hypothetical protein